MNLWGQDIGIAPYKIKVDSTHNTITIHSIKDSCNREEVVSILEKYANNYSMFDTKINRIFFEKFIEENL